MWIQRQSVTRGTDRSSRKIYYKNKKGREQQLGVSNHHCIVNEADDGKAQNSGWGLEISRVPAQGELKHMEVSSGGRVPSPGEEKKSWIPSEDRFLVPGKLSSHSHQKSPVVRKASLPTIKTWRSRGMQCFASNSLPVLHSQEATTTCNQLDGSNSPAGSYQAMGQQQYQKCIQPHPSLWESAVSWGVWPHGTQK